MSDIYDIKERLAGTLDDTERLKLLNELTLKLSRIDPAQGLRYALDADRLAQQCGSQVERAESFRAAAWCHETLSDYEQAMLFAETSRTLFREAGDRNGEGKALNTIGVIAFGRSQFGRALEALTEARTIFIEEGNPHSLASACNNTGMVYQEMGNYPEALAAYLEALRLNEELGEESQAAVNIGNVSNIYYYLGDTERSFEFDKRALAIARRLNDRYGMAHALESIASNYKERGEFNHALDALTEGLEIFRGMGEQRYEAAALIKLGSLYENLDQPERALEEFRRAAAIAESIGRKDSLANAHLHIGLLLSRRGEYAEAIPALRAGLAEARKQGMLKLETDLLGALADALNAAGKRKEAFLHLKDHAVQLENLYGEERQRAVAEMQARFDVERAEREREVLRLKNKHLEELMELRSRELVSMAMRLVRNNAFLQKLRKETLQLAAENPTSKEVLDTLLKAITENIHSDNEWERFEQEFQLIHHDFLERLSGRCPRLTPAELKVCAMLKLNLSNKEMANLLSVSLRNIESHRYSIRKKLGLPSDVNLTAYLVGSV